MGARNLCIKFARAAHIPANIFHILVCALCSSFYAFPVLATWPWLSTDVQCSGEHCCIGDNQAASFGRMD